MTGVAQERHGWAAQLALLLLLSLDDDEWDWAVDTSAQARQPVEGLPGPRQKSELTASGGLPYSPVHGPSDGASSDRS